MDDMQIITTKRSQEELEDLKKIIKAKEDENCIFCKIIKGEIPAEIICENDYAIAFENIQKEAKEHFLVIPKMHVTDILDIVTTSSKGCDRGRKAKQDTLNEVFKLIAQAAQIKGIDKTGFRVTTNCGKDANQSVFHLHFHVAGGEDLSKISKEV